MNHYYRIHLINGDILTACEQVTEEDRDLVTFFAHTDPDELLELRAGKGAKAFIPVRNIMFISRHARIEY